MIISTSLPSINCPHMFPHPQYLPTFSKVADTHEKNCI